MEIACPKCGAAYSIGPDLAGHRVQCASCGERFDAAGGEGHSGLEPAGRIWNFRMPGGQKFGPLSKRELDEYLFEGILTAECQVICEGDERWQWAGEVYPEVAEKQSQASRHGGQTESHRGGLATAGLLERIPTIRPTLPAEHARSHDLLDAQIAAEVAEMDLPLQILGSRTIGLVQSVAFGRQFAENFGAVLPPRANVLVNSLAISALATQDEEFYLVAPYSNLEPLPHEFFAILPGKLPAGLLLRAGGSSPVWMGEDRSSHGAVATAMRHVPTELGQGALTKWASRDKRMKILLDWTVQMVPFGSEQFVLIAQTAGIGRKKRRLGLEWFVEQMSHAKELRDSLGVPGDCHARFPMHSESAELIARMFGD